MFENMVLRRIFGPKWNKVTGVWRKLQNEDLSDLCSLPNIIRITKSRRMIWAGYVAQTAKKRNEFRILMEKGEGKRPLRRPRRRWGDNIKTNVTEVRWGGMDQVCLDEDRNQWRVETNEPSGVVTKN
jgi:hypothetical protein